MIASRMRWFAAKAALPAVVVTGIGVIGTQQVAAQSSATAVQPLGLSAFGAATGTWTGLEGGRNLGITAGVDLAFLTYRRFRPVLEVRGNYPAYSGKVDDQRSLLGGLRVERDFGRLHPYADFLFGRGGINYVNGGFYRDGLLYYKTTTSVYSAGLGVDYDLTPQWAAKLDFQYQHWGTPVIPAESINPRAVSIGAVYRFDFNPHYKVKRGGKRHFF